MNFYVENLVSNLSIGILILDLHGNIIWTSKFIELRFGKKIINKSISTIISDLDLTKKQSDFKKIVIKDEFVYEARFHASEFIVTLKDITQEYTTTKFYEIERPVVGEIDIDNFQQYQSLLSEEELFLVQSAVINFFETLVKKYNFVYRQYLNSKFIIFTNKDVLNTMISNSFKDFNKLNDIDVIKNKRISLSIGFGTDSSNLRELLEMSKIGIQQSQSRGGNQITVISKNESPQYFGSNSVIAPLKSRTKIKIVAERFKSCLEKDSIENIIIYGHKVADLDALGAAYAIYEIAKSYNKEVFIQNQSFDNTTKKAISKYIKSNSEIFISPSKAVSLTTKKTMIVIVDCADESRVENSKIFFKAKSKNIFIFDHHRISKLNSIIDESNVYIESTASSTSEIITELISFCNYQNIISQKAIQLLLNGIYLDTLKFEKTTSSRTFVAASLLEEWGASPIEASSILKISESSNEIISKILSTLKEVKPGYWLAAYRDTVPSDVVSIAAEEILKIEGRKAAFVIAKQPKKTKFEPDVFKLSARSIDINVQIIVEAVGGGGHFNSAAALSDGEAKETFETFTSNVIQAIVSTK